MRVQCVHVRSPNLQRARARVARRIVQVGLCPLCRRVDSIAWLNCQVVLGGATRARPIVPQGRGMARPDPIMARVELLAEDGMRVEANMVLGGCFAGEDRLI